MQRPIPPLRVAAILGIAGFLLFGPVWVQVLGNRTGIHRSWQMYSGAGRSSCQVEFFQADREGALTPIDRVELLYGGRPWWERSHRERRLQGVDAIRREASRLCRAVGGRADVRAQARCGSRTHWKPALSTDKKLCDARGGAR